MKPLAENELFESVSGFLKTRGIELKDGSYVQGIRRGCSLLSDAINVGQQGIEKAKDGLDKKLDELRQTIHEKTAPEPKKRGKPQPKPQSKAAGKSAAKPVKPKRAKARKA
jgi:hypothetical protein